MQFTRSLLWLVPFSMSLASCAGPGSPTTDICSATAYTPNYVSDVNLKRWESVPIRVFFQTNTTVSGVNIENEARQGFDEWESELGQNLWTEVTSAGSANLVVKVQSSAPQSTLAETTIYFFQGQNIITRAEMTIYTWPSLSLTGYAGTSSHELGHALGINGHSSSNADIMYFSGNSTDLLTLRDLNTLRTAYCGFGVLAKSAAPLAGTPLVSERITCPAH